MSAVPIPPPIHREPELLGQTVVVIGGSAGIGFETARRRRWQSQEPLPLGVWSRKPSARRPGRAGNHFRGGGVRLVPYAWIHGAQHPVEKI